MQHQLTKAERMGAVAARQEQRAIGRPGMLPLNRAFPHWPRWLANEPPPPPSHRTSGIFTTARPISCRDGRGGATTGALG